MVVRINDVSTLANLNIAQDLSSATTLSAEDARELDALLVAQENPAIAEPVQVACLDACVVESGAVAAAITYGLPLLAAGYYAVLQGLKRSPETSGENVLRSTSNAADELPTTPTLTSGLNGNSTESAEIFVPRSHPGLIDIEPRDDGDYVHDIHVPGDNIADRTNERDEDERLRGFTPAQLDYERKFGAAKERLRAAAAPGAWTEERLDAAARIEVERDERNDRADARADDKRVKKPREENGSRE